MRTISRTALSTCNIPLLPNQKYVSVQLLTGDLLHFVSEVKGLCKTVFEQVCNYLGLNDAELFNLAVKHENEYVFIEQALKLYKYAPKTWKTQDSGLDGNGEPLLMFYLRVQLYVDCHLLISDKVARHHYYLQIRENVSSYSLPLSDERAFLLAAYALQADLGNFNEEKNLGNYFDPLKYFPISIIRKLGERYVCQHTPALHRDNVGLSRGEAQVGYIKEASEISAAHNLHFYKMKRKKGKIEDFVWLAISHKSVQIYEDNGMNKCKLATFPWADITKIHFEKKKFEIRCLGCLDTRKFTYYLKSEEVSKSLLWLCRIMHQFSMVVQPKVVELEKMELEASIPFRESYIYSDRSDLNWERSRGSSTKASNGLIKHGADEQRISVISSSASSNTTSGVVSDKVHSYESEEEIMITNPPQPAHFSGNSTKDLNETKKLRSVVSERILPSVLASPPLNKTLLSSKSEHLNFPVLPMLSPSNNPKGSSKPLKSSSKSSLNINKSSPATKSESFTFLVPNKPVCGTYPKTESKPAQRNSVCGVPYADSDAHFPMGVQTLNSHHGGRNVTRIGVSSLTKGKQQRLPLAIYTNRQVGSEPELNHLRSWSSTYSTDSEHSLPAHNCLYPAGHFNSNMYRKHSAESNLCGSVTSVSTMSSVFSSNAHQMAANNGNHVRSANGSIDSTGVYPTIPPPLAYATQDELNKIDEVDSANNGTKSEPPSLPNGGVLKQSQSQVDMEQLWKKSHNMDVPLLTALCNDRSLMMLPKTIALCSRQRHIGVAKDMRRFSCSSMLTPSEEKTLLPPISATQTLGGSRNGSTNNWHSEYYEWLNHVTTAAKQPLPLSVKSEHTFRPHSYSTPSDIHLVSNNPFVTAANNCNGTVA